MAWLAFCMTITIPCWDGDDGGFPEDGVFVLYDPADEFQGLVAIVLLGRDQRLVEDQAHQIGRRCLLEIGDEMPGGLQPVPRVPFRCRYKRTAARSRSAERGCPPGRAA